MPKLNIDDLIKKCDAADILANIYMLASIAENFPKDDRIKELVVNVKKMEAELNSRNVYLLK